MPACLSFGRSVGRPLVYFTLRLSAFVSVGLCA
jgi:hypothetical protein